MRCSAVCCSLLQLFAVCCNVIQGTSDTTPALHHIHSVPLQSLNATHYIKSTTLIRLVVGMLVGVNPPFLGVTRVSVETL